MRYFDSAKRDQELCALLRKVDAYESGEEVQRLRKEKEQWRGRCESGQEGRKKDTAKAERKYRRVSMMWQSVNDDLWENTESLAKENGELTSENDALKKENGELGKQLEEAMAFTALLMHRLAQNHTNRSIPSSIDRSGSAPKKDMAEEKDTDTEAAGNNHTNNSRRKSGKNPGAQPDHPHYPRKKLTPTTDPVLNTDPPKDTVDEDGRVITGEFIKRDEVVRHEKVHSG